MMLQQQRTCVFFAHFVLAALAVITVHQHALADPGVAVAPPPPAVAEVGVEEHLGATLPIDLTFRDHTGAAVRLDRYFAHTTGPFSST